MKKICVVILVCAMLLMSCAYASEGPQGTYVWYAAGIPMYSLTFEGNSVVSEFYGEEPTHGTFAQEGSEIRITYDDDMNDKFTYDSEDDTLSMFGADEMILTKSEEELTLNPEPDSGTMDALEELAVEDARQLKGYLKAPDTMVLKDDVEIINNEDAPYVLISYTEQNSYGVPLMDVAVFQGDDYLGSYDELKEISSKDIRVEDYSDLKKAQEDLLIQIDAATALKEINEGRLQGAVMPNYVYKIEGSVVARALKIEYSPN